MSGFLEAFANRGHVVGKRPGRNAKTRVRLGLTQIDGPFQDPLIRVLRIERAAGEDVGAAEKSRALRALDHQHLGPFGAVAQQDQRGGGTRNHWKTRNGRTINAITAASI